jgi:hypothetical protein
MVSGGGVTTIGGRLVRVRALHKGRSRQTGLEQSGFVRLQYSGKAGEELIVVEVEEGVVLGEVVEVR